MKHKGRHSHQHQGTVKKSLPHAAWRAGISYLCESVVKGVIASLGVKKLIRMHRKDLVYAPCIRIVFSKSFGLTPERSEAEW